MGVVVGGWRGGSRTAVAWGVQRCTDLSLASRYTGYNGQGEFCDQASPKLDEEPHLIMHSGRLGVVLDAAGLDPALGIDATNLIPKLGAVQGCTVLGAGAASPREVYDELPNSTAAITLERTCSDPSESGSFVLGTLDASNKNTKEKFVQIGLVRQGHTVTQLTTTALDWRNDAGDSYAPTCERVADPTPSGGKDNTGKCTHDASSTVGHRCDGDYPICIGHIPSEKWGVCHSYCGDPIQPELWLESSVWGDSILFRLAWNADSASLTSPAGCSAVVTIALTAEGLDVESTATIAAGADAGGSLSLRLVATVDDGGTPLDPSDDVTTLGARPPGDDPGDITVVSSSSGATVIQRDDAGDVFVSVPDTLPKCGYNMQCGRGDFPQLVSMTATNIHTSESRTLRLSFSRNFNTKSGTLKGGRPGAEITGFSVQLWDDPSKQPTGIPVQISKNWHSGNSDAYWAGFDGTWWTASSLIRLPPNSQITLYLAISYELYGGLRPYSHAQLSIVGYSDKWLWEESALGTGGENMCFDPTGAHTRAMVTDIRPKLFDGAWKENVGGADFVMLFGESGAMQYLKEMDPLIHTSGPCLSHASYPAVTADGSISTKITVQGGRTDDLVRVHMRIQLTVRKPIIFSRLVFFQLGSETYNYHPTFEKIIYGSGDGYDEVDGGWHEQLLTCDGGTSRKPEHMYANVNDLPYRKAMGGSAPWWFSMGSNTDSVEYSNNVQVVGDKGFIVRTFNATLGGVTRSRPSFSVLCDKVELGAPAGLSELQEGDFLDMAIELLVLPRSGAEYSVARSKNPESKTLAALEALLPAERVQAHAERLVVLPLFRARVESHYPVRVCATRGSSNLLFEVEGNMPGFTPIVICGLNSHDVATAGRGLWIRPSGGSTFAKIDQSSTNQNHDFWQTNYVPQRGTYEFIFNLEFGDARAGRVGCFLAYCNDHTDLQEAYCDGGVCSTAAQAILCDRHWATVGRHEISGGTRGGSTADTEACLASAAATTMTVGFGTNPDTWPTGCTATIAHSTNGGGTGAITGDIDAVVAVECQDGYEGSTNSTCLPTGNFTTVVCTPKPCTATEVPNSLDHAGTGSITGVTGEVVLVECTDGYDGGGAATCHPDGQFVVVPCTAPTSNPSRAPGANPSVAATGAPTGALSGAPTGAPSRAPSKSPTTVNQPQIPTAAPTVISTADLLSATEARSPTSSSPNESSMATTTLIGQNIPDSGRRSSAIRLPIVLSTALLWLFV